MSDGYKRRDGQRARQTERQTDKQTDIKDEEEKEETGNNRGAGESNRCAEKETTRQTGPTACNIINIKTNGNVIWPD